MKVKNLIKYIEKYPEYEVALVDVNRFKQKEYTCLTVEMINKKEKPYNIISLG